MEAYVNGTGVPNGEAGEGKRAFGGKFEKKAVGDRSSEGSEITVKQFLDFLKTAYQVQDNIEGILRDEGMTEIVDWLELKQNNLVRPKDIAVQTSETKIKDNKDKRRFITEDADSTLIKRKLSEILSEGIFDSVLPYIVPNDVGGTQRRSSIAKMQGCGADASATSIEEKVRKSKSVENLPFSKQIVVKADSEVEIHVHDELKNVKKDFVCNQRLLVQQMGYFADVTAGQKLEDMDISVHCDIGIFEWLMRWVKRDNNSEGDLPELDSTCAIPVLVSAAFLQMDPLTDECLRYCHENMSDILRTNASLSCLNDSVLGKLASMYTNAEVEEIKDRKDKIQSKLFCKLIQALCDPEPESLRGHFSTMGRIYRCKYCRKLVNPLIEEYLPCIPACTTLELDGAVTSKHVRDSNWNITDYVAGLHSQLKTWRKVYWRIWGDAHFLYCTTCKKYFPARQAGWCQYHPDPPQYFTVDAQRAPLPVGRYPCCGERAYRFQLLDDSSGCKFRDHEACTAESRDALVASMLHAYRHLIAEEPPELMFPERLTRLVARDHSADEDGALECKEAMWWEGLQIVPQRPKLGMFGLLDDPHDDESDSGRSEEESVSESSPASTSSTSSSSESPGSEEYSTVRKKPTRKRKRPKIKRKDVRLWQHKLSARSNQDLQRSHEEVALKDIAGLLARKMVSSSEVHSSKASKSLARRTIPTGGIWVRLENDWKEANAAGTRNRQLSGSKTKAKCRQ